MVENYFGITDKGKQRSNNEDTFIAQLLSNSQLIAACVIDGVGGYEGGEVAAELAQQAIIKQLGQSFSDVYFHLNQAILVANSAIIKEKEEKKANEQMACVLTLAIVDLDNNKCYYAHVGDTRLYLFRDGTLIKITKDHSFVGFLEDTGRLTEQAAMQHPKRNEINKALGFEKDFKVEDYIEHGEFPFLPGDLLLLCSDGLSDMIDIQTITTILSSSKTLAEKGKELIDVANEAGGKDNITVVLVRNDNQPLKLEVRRPVINKNITSTSAAISGLENSQKEIKERVRNSGLKRVIVLLTIIVLAVLCMLIYLKYIKSSDPKIGSVISNSKGNLLSQSFIDSTSRSNNRVFILKRDGDQPIVISDSITINQDTLLIIGNGAVFISDTSYRGPAFVLGPNCKSIVFDSLNLKNFETGFVVKSPALYLQKVFFNNCKLKVQYNFMSADSSSNNGINQDSVFYHSAINFHK